MDTQVFNEFQTNVWRSINYRRLQWNYINNLQRYAFDEWKSNHRQLQHIERFRQQSSIRSQAHFFHQWKAYLLSHHENRDFKYRLRLRRLLPWMNAWKRIHSIQRYHRRWHDHTASSWRLYERYLSHELFHRWRNRCLIYRVLRIFARHRDRIAQYEAWTHWIEYCECAQLLYDKIPLAESPFGNDSDFTSPRSTTINAISPHRHRRHSKGRADITDQENHSHVVDGSPDSKANSEISFNIRSSPSRIASGHRGMLSLIQESRRSASTIWNRLRYTFLSSKDIHTSSKEMDPDDDN